MHAVAVIDNPLLTNIETSFLYTVAAAKTSGHKNPWVKASSLHLINPFIISLTLLLLMDLIAS